MMNQKFIARLKETMATNEVTQAELAKRTGIRASSISDYLNNKYEPKQDKIYIIAEALNVNAAWLMGRDDDNSKVANQPQKKSSCSIIPNWQYPFIEAPISAGALESVEAINELPKVSVPDSFIGKYARGHDIVFMRVNGESMNNVIENHTVIAVQTGLEKEQLTNGDIVIACNHGEYTVKHFINDEQNRRIILRPDSSDPAFSDIIIPYEEADEFSIFGKVVVYSVML